MVAQRLAQIHSRLKQFKSPKVRVIAVTKGRKASDLHLLIEQGHQEIGESRFGELRDKIAAPELRALKPEEHPVYHHIGLLQKGNARQIASLFSFTHSVSDMDSLGKLMEAAKRCRDREERNPFPIQRLWPMKYFIQLRLSGEDSKAGGMSTEEFLNLSSYPQNDSLLFAGLMTMGPENNDPHQTREVFQQLRELKDKQAPEGLLSMGMSRDWEIAVEEGADLIRVGRLLFM